jgi:hypothetical protein
LRQNNTIAVSSAFSGSNCIGLPTLIHEHIGPFGPLVKIFL